MALLRDMVSSEASDANKNEKHAFSAMVEYKIQLAEKEKCALDIYLKKC